MLKYTSKVTSILLCFLLIFEQAGFAQAAAQLGIPAQLASSFFVPDRFRPLHLRSVTFEPQTNNFKLLLDKGDFFSLRHSEDEPKARTNNLNHNEILRSAVGLPQDDAFQQETAKLMQYFRIGLALPNSSFWVNLRPDQEDKIIEDSLAKTDLGKVLLEADLALKKDLAAFTSPDTLEGKFYWDKLYAKADQLFGDQEIEIPTYTRPWIVPGEIILRETRGDGSTALTTGGRGMNPSAYIYKATLKVMLEEDYLAASTSASTSAYDSDPRLQELNSYSSELIRQLIIPKLTKTVNSSKRYAALRQVYYSLILAQWFKAAANQKTKELKNLKTEKQNPYLQLINSQDLRGLTSTTSWDKSTYYNAYRQSFEQGEYNKEETVWTPAEPTIRSYVSGGLSLGQPLNTEIITVNGPIAPINPHLIEIPRYTGAGETSVHKEIYEIENLSPDHSRANEAYIRASRLLFLLQKARDSQDKDELMAKYDSVHPSSLNVPLNREDIDTFIIVVEGIINRIKKESFTHIDFESLIREQIEKLREVASPLKISIIFDDAPADALITVDLIGKDDCFYHLGRVVWEVLGNAVKYSYETGKVIITLAKEGGYFVLQIEDHGIGITAEEMSNVGAFGYRSKRAKEHQIFGLGIGFSNSKEKIEKLFSGTLEIKSPGEGQGTTVTIRMPENIAPADKQNPAPPSNSPSPVAEKAAPGASADGGTNEQRESSIEHSDGVSTKGGIDFTSLSPATQQSLVNLRLALSGADKEAFSKLDLSKESQEIEGMMESGVLPQAEEFRNYLLACCIQVETRGRFPLGNGNILSREPSPITAQAIARIAQLLRAEEEDCYPTDAFVKDVLVVIESA